MAATYPRKQTSLILAICLIAVALVWIYSRQSTAQTAEKSPSLAIAAQPQQADLAISTSTYWKKAFY